MELVVNNVEGPVNNLILPKEVVAVLQSVIAPYLKEGVDVRELTQKVEVELVKSGSKKLTEWLVKKFL